MHISIYGFYIEHMVGHGCNIAADITKYHIKHKYDVQTFDE